MAAGASPPTDLEKYGLTLQNPDFGPKWRFGFQTPLNVMDLGISGAMHLNRKMYTSLPAARYTIPAFTRGFSLKFAFQGTLEPYSTSAPPHFHRFPSY